MRKLPEFWQHLIIWLFLVLTEVLSLLSDSGSSYAPQLSIFKTVLFHLLYAVIFYTSYSFTKSFKAFWRYIISASTILLFPLGSYGIYYLISVVFSKSNLGQMSWAIYFYYLGTGFIFSASGLFLRRARNSIVAENKAHQLEKEKAVAESRYLRSKLNPHFLFNALNSIYALSLKGSKRLPNAVLQLSALLRYVLEQSDRNEVGLSDEVNLLENYMALQKHRLPDNFKLDYKKEISVNNIKVIPMLFITLAENCFKHGDLSEEGLVFIELKVDNEEIVFKTKNKLEKVASAEEGIGLSNLRSRLCQHYGNAFRLDTGVNAGNFEAVLTISL